RYDRGAVLFWKRSHLGAACEQHVQQPLKERGVALENGLNPEPLKQTQRRLFGECGEPDQGSIELRGRGRQVHLRTVEGFKRFPSGFPSRENGLDSVDELGTNIEVAHAS